VGGVWIHEPGERNISKYHSMHYAHGKPQLYGVESLCPIMSMLGDGGEGWVW
jgi:hypothetical protein